MEREQFRQKFNPGQLIVEENDAGDTWFIIEKGKVLVYTDQDGGREEIARLGEGQIIGELSSLEDQAERKKRSASAEAITEVTCLEMNQQHLKQFLAENEDFRWKFFKTLSKRLSDTTRELSRFQSIEAKIRKLTAYVLALVNPHDLQQHQKEINYNFSLDDLENSLGMNKVQLEDYLSMSLDDEKEIGPDDRLELRSTMIKLMDKILDSFNLNPESFKE